MKTEALMIEKIKEDFNILDRAVEMLEYSLQQCRKIGIKTDYSLEELDRFESLLSFYYDSQASLKV